MDDDEQKIPEKSIDELRAERDALERENLEREIAELRARSQAKKEVKDSLLQKTNEKDIIDTFDDEYKPKSATEFFGARWTEKMI